MKTFKNNKITVLGTPQKVGMVAPDFTVPLNKV